MRGGGGPAARRVPHLGGVRRVEEAQLAEGLVRRRAGAVGQRRAGLLAPQAVTASSGVRRGAAAVAAALVRGRRRGGAGHEVGSGRLHRRGAEPLLLPRVPLLRQRRRRGLHLLLFLLLQQGRVAPRRGASRRERGVRLLEGRVLAGAVAAAAAFLLLVLVLLVAVPADEQQLLPDRGGHPPGRDPPRRRRRLLQAEKAHGGCAANPSLTAEPGRAAPAVAAPRCPACPRRATPLGAAAAAPRGSAPGHGSPRAVRTPRLSRDR